MFETSSNSSLLFLYTCLATFFNVLTVLSILAFRLLFLSEFSISSSASFCNSPVSKNLRSQVGFLYCNCNKPCSNADKFDKSIDNSLEFSPASSIALFILVSKSFDICAKAALASISLPL